MIEPETETTLTLEQRRVDNLRHAREINSYWRARGVESNARVVLDGVRVDLEDGTAKTVLSAEIVSDVGAMMARALPLGA